MADANIAAHPYVHTAAPAEPPSSITPPAPQSSAAPKLLEHSGSFGDAWGTNADAGVACAVVRKLYLDAEEAQRFIAMLHATQHTSLDDLPDKHLATVGRIARSCAASCMQLWAAVIHYDVARVIVPTIAQHPQHEQHFPPDAAPADATRGAYGRVCKAVATPAQEQVAHNGAQSAPTGGSAPPTGSLPPLPKDAQCSVYSKGAERSICDGKLLPEADLPEDLGGLDKDLDDLRVGLHHTQSPRSPPSALRPLYGDVALVLGALQPPKGAAPGSFNALEVPDTAMQGDGVQMVAAVDASLRQGHDPKNVLALAHRCSSPLPLCVCFFLSTVPAYMSFALHQCPSASSCCSSLSFLSHMQK